MITDPREREHELKKWTRQLINTELQLNNAGLIVAKGWKMISGDASFRRYFRLVTGEKGEDRSWILVDSRPDKEKNREFVQVLSHMKQAGVRVPAVRALDYERGYLCLSDLGDQLLLPLLNEQSVDAWYQCAQLCLRRVQRTLERGLPIYNESLLRTELNLFHEWFLPKYLGIELNESQQAELEACYVQLEASAVEQPRTFVHRDFHSRNLMVVDTDAEPHVDSLAVIDFQDAVDGPITYDLVSLLKDCYIKWSAEQVDQWALNFLTLLQNDQVAVLAEITEQQWLRWFDWMGLQRHIKVAGIFVRLYERDGKDGYLKDIPRVVSYILDTVTRYKSDFSWFYDFLTDTVIPELINKDASAKAFFHLNDE